MGGLGWQEIIFLLLVLGATPLAILVFVVAVPR